MQLCCVTVSHALVSILFLVDGSYSGWYQVSSCTRSCGGGTMTWKRKCDNPSPRNGGKQCQGPAVELRSCANIFCKGRLIYHMIRLQRCIHGSRNGERGKDDKLRF